MNEPSNGVRTPYETPREPNADGHAYSISCNGKSTLRKEEKKGQGEALTVCDATPFSLLTSCSMEAYSAMSSTEAIGRMRVTRKEMGEEN